MDAVFFSKLNFLFTDTKVHTFVVSSRSREILYSDVNDKTIYRSKLDRTSSKSIFSHDSPATLLAMDEENGSVVINYNNVSNT